MFSGLYPPLPPRRGILNLQLTPMTGTVTTKNEKGKEMQSNMESGERS